MSWCLNADTPPDDATPLMLSSFEGDLEKVKQLVRQCVAYLEHSSRWVAGCCMLLVATSHRKVCLSQVEQDGVDLNARIKDGSTALILAAARGHTAIVQYLVSKGGNMHYTDDQGFNALSYAIFEGHQETYGLLLGAGADTNMTAHNPLILALIGGSFIPSRVQKMLEPGVEKFFTIKAEVLDPSSIIPLLLSYGAKADLPCKMPGNGVGTMLATGAAAGVATPLMVASLLANAEAVKAFAKTGCDLDWKDENGRTALMIGAALGYTQIVNILLHYGADATIKDFNGNAAADLAMAGRHLDLADKIKDHVASQSLVTVVAAMIKSRLVGKKEQRQPFKGGVEYKIDPYIGFLLLVEMLAEVLNNKRRDQAEEKVAALKNHQLGLPLIGLCGVSSLMLAASKIYMFYTKAYSASWSSSSKPTPKKPLFSPIAMYGSMMSRLKATDVAVYHQRRQLMSSAATPGVAFFMPSSARTLNSWGHVSSRFIMRRMLK